MMSRIVYACLFISFLLIAPGCRVKRKEYIERHGLHSDDKPSEIAKDGGNLAKKEQRAYHKLMKKRYKKKHPHEKWIQKPG